MDNNLSESVRPANATELMPLFLPPFVTIPLGALIGACVVVGLPVKFVFYRYLSGVGGVVGGGVGGSGVQKKNLFEAINKMIFFEQVRSSEPTIASIKIKLQGPSKARAPGCVNTAGKARQKQ